MEEDYDVIFEGSDIHKYLESLDILENEEVHQRIPNNILKEMEKIEKKCENWRQFYSNSFISILKNNASQFVEWMTQEKQYNARMSEFIGTLLCSKNALTLDDRLYLYHFSPTFSRIVEEEVNQCSDELPFRLKLLTLATLISFVPLSYFGFSLPASVLLLPPCLMIVRFLKRNSKRSVQVFVERLLEVLTDVERKSLPQAISAATEVAILSSGSHFTEDSTLQKVNSQCVELLKMSAMTIERTFTIFEACGIHGEKINFQSWSDVKEGKKLIEILLSRFSKELMMQCDGTSEDQTNNIILSVHDVCIRHSQLIDNLEYQNGLMLRQINLMKQSWFAPRQDASSPRIYSEEERSLKSLQLHAKKMITLIDCYEQTFGDKNEDKVDKYELLKENLDKINTEVATIKEDCDVLHEIAEQILKKNDTKVSEPLIQPVRNDAKPEDLPEIEPHVPKDEFLEGDPIATDSVPSDDPWFEEYNKEEETRKLLRVQNKRVLSELQPILTQKKLEFDKREKIAKGIEVDVNKSEAEEMNKMNDFDSKTRITETTPFYYHFQTCQENTNVFAVVDCEQKMIIFPFIRVNESIVTSIFSKNESISNELCLPVFTVNGMDNNIQYPLDLKDESIHTCASLESVSLLLKNNDAFHRCANISSTFVNEVCSLFLEQFDTVSKFELLPHKNNTIIYNKYPIKPNKEVSMTENENRSRVFECGSVDSNSAYEEGDWEDKNLTLHERLQKAYLNSAAEEGAAEGDEEPVHTLGGLHFCSELASLAASKAKIGFNNSSGFGFHQTRSEEVFGCDGDSESE